MTLLYRIVNIVSQPQHILQEVEKLKIILKKNNYPQSFIDKCIARFYTIRQSPPTHLEDNSRKDDTTIVLPYLGTMSSRIHTKLSKLFKKCFPLHNLNLIYKTTYRMGNMFRYKDQFPPSIHSDLVYLYKCGTVGPQAEIWPLPLFFYFFFFFYILGVEQN